MNGGRRTRQIEDLINFDIQWKRHIVPHHLEVVLSQVRYIPPAAGIEIVNAKYVGAIIKQSFA